MVSIAHHSPKAVSLKMALAVGTVGRTYILVTGEAGEEPSVSLVQLEGHLEVMSWGCNYLL